MKHESLIFALAASALILTGCGQTTPNTTVSAGTETPATTPATTEQASSVISEDKGTSSVVPSAPATTEKATTDQRTTRPPREYTVKFVSNGETIAEETGVRGAEVDIPDDPDNGPKGAFFRGWTGVTPEEKESGKVKITGNKTYTARWGQKFGTDTEFHIYKLAAGQHITIDGDGSDEAWESAEKAPLDAVLSGEPGTTGSTFKAMWDDENLYLLAEVVDSTNDANDLFHLRLDLLHSDEFVEGYNGGGWGSVYRGNDGPCVEFGATYKRDNSVDYAFEWWSNSIKNNENGTSNEFKVVATEKGYNVEIRLDTRASTGNMMFNHNGAFDMQNYLPHVGHTMGIGAIVTNGSNGGTSAIEENNRNMDDDARTLTNFTFAAAK